ncbi:MAG: ribonuclease III [Planctomycetia bacterium]|nr:ribonuclease III [Planctomycetia bacterium]
MFDESTLATLVACQEALEYQFKEPHYLASALTHSSSAVTRLVSNERLEFLGDAILGLVIVDMLFHRCESLMEGEMTQMKSVIVSRATCNRVSRSLHLENFMFLGKGMEKRKLPPSLLANLQEAIIGAIYLDGGLDAAREYILRAFHDEIEKVLSGEPQSNFKMLLQQYAQRHYHQTPSYRVLEQKGPDHSRCFRVQVQVSGLRFQSAWGKNKKEAEQHAAENAMAQIEKRPPVYPADDE